MRTREEQISQLKHFFASIFPDMRPSAKQALNAVAKAYIEEAEERVRAECAADTRRLDYLDSGCCDVRFRSEPIADTGDADTYCDIIEHHMAEPKECIVGSADTIRAAIDAAMEGRNG